MIREDLKAEGEMTASAQWLAMIRLPGMGAVRIRRLLDHLGDIDAVLAAGPALLSRSGIPDKAIAALRAYQQDPEGSALGRSVARDLAWLSHPQHHLLTCASAEYPRLLAQCDNAPVALFVQGDHRLLSSPQIAVVGSRRPSVDGLTEARSFARQLSRVGLTVTSGLAYGIDGAAHQGTLECDGRTIAVLGSGVDRIYPARHRELARQIVSAGGALVSEFPLGTAPQARNFPMRNRIISGLSLGTLVIEASLNSGSLITARQAIEQGREVFAIPGSIRNPQTKGCHALLREGAKLVETTEDIVEELQQFFVCDATISDPDGVTGEAALKTTSSEALSPLQQAMGYEAVTVDLLVERTGMSVERIGQLLVEGELEGSIRRVAGGYQRI